METLILAARFGWRDLRGGFQGLSVFIGCVAIGVAAIVAVNTIGRGLEESLAREGRSILGGDIAWSVPQREAAAAERSYFEKLGPVSAQATARAMARVGETVTLAEIKAIDPSYPLAGRLETSPGGTYTDLFGKRGGVFGAVAEAALIEKLKIKVGDHLNLAGLDLELRAQLDGEPDKLAAGIGFGPRLMISAEALRQTTLLAPGSLVRWTYRVALEQADEVQLQTIIAQSRAAFPEAGFDVRTRRNASPQLGTNIARFTQFLDLVGLTALLIGGVGVANAVAAQVEARKTTIATLKVLGAGGGFAALVYLIETVMIALLAIALGMVMGLALPFALLAGFRDLLPLNVTFGVYPKALLLAAVYGLAIALAFAAWALGSAHDVPVQALYRGDEARRRRPRLIYVGISTGAALLVLLVAIRQAEDWRVPAIYTLSAIGAFLVLRLAAFAVVRAARRLPRSHFLPLRLALTSLHRPGAPTGAVILSLGLGLTLLSALGLVEHNLSRQLLSALPKQAPSFYFLDVRESEWPAFKARLEGQAPGSAVEAVSLLRGRIVRLNDIAAEDAKATADAAWVLSGDRGLTTAEALPDNQRLVEGTWWSKDDHRALVSFEDKLAKGLGLKIGDHITVNVLGRNITAVLANTRTVRWETLGINFVMLFSPATFRGAPMGKLATLSLPAGANVRDETDLLRRLADEFPSVSAIRVREALETINALVAKLALAVRGAAAIAVIASFFVLAGAFAASHRARLHDAAILKALGASRFALTVALAAEFALLGLVTAAIGMIAGHGLAYLIVTLVMKADFEASFALTAGIAGVSVAVTLIFGLLGAWRLLRVAPSRLLRAI